MILITMRTLITTIESMTTMLLQAITTLQNMTTMRLLAIIMRQNMTTIQLQAIITDRSTTTTRLDAIIKTMNMPMELTMVTITGLLTIFLTSRRKIRSLALLDLAQARPGVAKTNSVSTCMSTKNMIIQSQPHLVLKEVQDLSQLRLVLMDNGAESKMPSMGKVSTSMVIMAIRAPTSTKTQSLPSSM